MKHNTRSSKLSLHTETVRRLASPQLALVIGGEGNPPPTPPQGMTISGGHVTNSQ